MSEGDSYDWTYEGMNYDDLPDQGKTLFKSLIRLDGRVKDLQSQMNVLNMELTEAQAASIHIDSTLKEIIAKNRN